MSVFQIETAQKSRQQLEPFQSSWANAGTVYGTVSRRARGDVDSELACSDGRAETHECSIYGLLAGIR